MGKGAIPDRWLDYQPLGRCISGTKIVAFKVPLRMNICQSSLEEKEWWHPTMLLEKEPRLKTVIDLTKTYRYYNGHEEFGTKGIDHVKILVEGRGAIPPESQIQRFFDAMDHHMEKYANDSDALVGVHCTHGLNRTGYFVCRWMADRLKMTPDAAIESFNQARGHDIERENLLDHLKTNLPRMPRSSDCPPPSRENQYYSPLNDSSYDEQSNNNYNRYSRYGGRGRTNNSYNYDSQRNREDRGRFERQRPYGDNVGSNASQDGRDRSYRQQSISEGNNRARFNRRSLIKNDVDRNADGIRKDGSGIQKVVEGQTHPERNVSNASQDERDRSNRHQAISEGNRARFNRRSLIKNDVDINADGIRKDGSGIQKVVEGQTHPERNVGQIDSGDPKKRDKYSKKRGRSRWGSQSEPSGADLDKNWRERGDNEKERGTSDGIGSGETRHISKEDSKREENHSII